MLAGPKSPQILLTEEIVGSEILLAEDFERIIYRVIFFNWASTENVS